MRKLILLSIFTVIVLFSFLVIFMNSKSHIDEILQVTYKINNIIFTNQYVKNFLNKSINHTNYDEINFYTNKLDEQFQSILDEKEFPQFNKSIYKKDFLVIYETLKQQFILLEKVKSTIAALGNSYSYLGKLSHDDLDIKRYTVIRDIFALNFENIDVSKTKKIIDTMDSSKNDERLFIVHSTLVLEKSIYLQKLKSNIEKLNITQELESFSHKYLTTANDIREINKWILFISVFALIVSILLVVFFYYKTVLSQQEVNGFKNAVENSDNIVLVTDVNQKITYVNDVFTQSTGYKFEDIVGQTPAVLKSGLMGEDFYKNLNETIYSGKKWVGEFINLDKDGRKKYEKGSITPIFNTKNEIVSFLAIKLDITDEIETKQRLEENKKVLEKQAKMASLGEMLENIAHQWRQPLSVISTTASGVQLEQTHKILSDDGLYESMNNIIKTTQYLSSTIDDFRNFYKEDKSYHTFEVKDIISRSQNIIQSKLKKKSVILNSQLIEAETTGLSGELMQVFLNLYSNSSDAFKEPKTQEACSENMIFTVMKKIDGMLVIDIVDTAGGIDEKIIDRIFEPYFTTKHKAQGTGIGLYMTYKIVTETFTGDISVENKEFEYENKNYKGAKFTISLPIRYS